MKTLLDPGDRARLSARFRALQPDTRPRWGALTAPRMLTHLCDQMRYTLGEYPVRIRSGPYQWPVIKPLLMYWVPWPKGRIKGSPEMFLSSPTTWSGDLASLEALVDRFVRDTGQADWPLHPLFGRMTGPSWGRFCHRHLDHHLRQFGA
jgi:hypothetical protein